MPRGQKGLTAVKETDDQPAIGGLDACHLTFVGMALNEIAKAPDLDDRVVLKVTAICCAEPSRERLKTGATRTKAKMRVEVVEVLEGPTKPDAGPNLFDKDDDD